MKTENPNTPIFGTPEEARVAPKFEAKPLCRERWLISWYTMKR